MTDEREKLARLIAAHQTTTGMRVASGVTCQCEYWNGEEVAGKSMPVGLSGLMWHQAQVILAAGYRPAAEVAEECARIAATAGRTTSDPSETRGFLAAKQRIALAIRAAFPQTPTDGDGK